METQGHISMPGGSLKPQLSGWRSEAGGVSLTAVSLLVNPPPLSPLYTEALPTGVSERSEPTPCAVDKEGANEALSLKKGEG